jgi:hypothetical protein
MPHDYCDDNVRARLLLFGRCDSLHCLSIGADNECDGCAVVGSLCFFVRLLMRGRIRESCWWSIFDRLLVVLVWVVLCFGVIVLHKMLSGLLLCNVKRLAITLQLRILLS